MTSRFLIDFSSSDEFADLENTVNRAGLLQHIVVNRLAHAANSRQFFNQLSRRLIQFAEHSLRLRDISTLEEVIPVLMNLPIAYAEQVGQYYQALVINRNGQKYEAISLLETVADEAPIRYRARALHSLSGVHHELGQPDEALRFYPEALRAASSNNGRDLLTTLLVHFEVAWYKSATGDHQSALAHYETLSPLVQTLARQNSLYFYLYHNELAVELGELGRLAEAEAACAVALASPFAAAYPEWSETLDEIASKRQSPSRSVVAFNRVPEAKPQQIEPERKRRSVGAIRHRAPGLKKDSVQRSLIPIAASTAIFCPRITQSILAWMRKRIGPRAPTTPC